MEKAKYARNSFEVEAVQVTAENLNEVAEWCDGEVRYTVDEERNIKDAHVKVKIPRVTRERQRQAFVGDWVLKSDSGFKVYTKAAFASCFHKVSELQEVGS